MWLRRCVGAGKLLMWMWTTAVLLVVLPSQAAPPLVQLSLPPLVYLLLAPLPPM